MSGDIDVLRQQIDFLFNIDGNTFEHLMIIIFSQWMNQMNKSDRFYFYDLDKSCSRLFSFPAIMAC